MDIFGSNGIKQGIPSPPKSNIFNKNNSDQYEEYIDPNCGCKKIRKKIKTEENESNVEIQSEQIRTKDENETPKPKKSRSRKRE